MTDKTTSRAIISTIADLKRMVEDVYCIHPSKTAVELTADEHKAILPDLIRLTSMLLATIADETELNEREALYVVRADLSDALHRVLNDR